MRICFVGDSFVNGTGDPACLGWTGRICAALYQKGVALTYYNLGIRRETSADIRARWLDEVLRRLPKAEDGRVVFSFGTNDTTIENGKTRVDFADSLEHTHHILQSAKQLFPVMMVGPPPIADDEQNRQTARINEQFALVCKRLEVPYLDVFTLLQDSEVWRRETAVGDGAHPGAAGYAEFARLVQSWPPWLAWFA